MARLGPGTEARGRGAGSAGGATVAGGRDFLGNYQLTRLIRAGQTCQVWESRDIDHQRVCLKVLLPEMRTNKEELRYMRHEYEVGHPLDHPNVIKIYKLARDRNDVPFLVMEFHTGKNIKLLMGEGFDRIAYLVPTIIRTAAEGLMYFHEQGWVHRDVKPDNYLVGDEGVCKLIDFALAQKQASSWSKWLPGSRKVQGTRSYMAPEQIRAKPPDRRADIYSFGCMMFELVTGRTPFTAPNPDELLRKHLYQEAPPAVTAASSAAGRLLPAVSAWLGRCGCDRACAPHRASNSADRWDLSPSSERSSCCNPT